MEKLQRGEKFTSIRDIEKLNISDKEKETLIKKFIIKAE